MLKAATATSVGPVFMMAVFIAFRFATPFALTISSARTPSTSVRRGSSHALSFRILTPLSASFCNFTRRSVSFICSLRSLEMIWKNHFCMGTRITITMKPPTEAHPMYACSSAMYPKVCRIPLHNTLMNNIRSPTRCASSCMWLSTSPVVAPSLPAALSRIVLR